MPRSHLMTWEKSTRRWRKMFKGQVYVVSCRQLDAPETKEGSYQAANEWWLKQKAELDGVPTPRPNEGWITELERRKSWAQSQGDQTLTAALEKDISRLESEGIGDLSPSLARRTYLPEGELWEDRLSRILPAGPPPDADRTIASFVQRWLSNQKTRAQAGNISIAQFRNLTLYLNTFRDWIGPSLPIEAIDADRWDRFSNFLLERLAAGSWSPSHCEKLLRHARAFISWACKIAKVPIPENLHDRDKRISVPAPKIEVFTVQEVYDQLLHATGRLRLNLLLMINCGFTQRDISDIHPDEVDWSLGTITRKRSKTQRFESVRIVRYQLWPETFSLLRLYRSQDPDHVLLTQNGRPWVVRDTKEYDSIKTMYVYLCSKLEKKGLKPPLTLKYFRKTSASLLKSNPLYRDLVGVFLGHAPASIAEAHYADYPQQTFDEAIAWLRTQYKLPEFS